MDNEQRLYNNKLYNIANYLTIFIISNIIFSIMICPFMIYLLKPPEHWNANQIAFLSLLIGPAITALLSAMQKLVRYKDIAVWKDYFKAYRQNFGQSLFITAIMVFAVTMLYMDFAYFVRKDMKGIANVFMIFIILLIMISTYIYPILSRFNLKTIDIFKISFKMCMKRIYVPIGFVGIGAALIWTMKIFDMQVLASILGVSVMCYIVALIQKKDIDELEEELKSMYNIE